MGDVQTSGGASIGGSLETNGGGFVGRDRPENNTTVNVNETLSSYTMADLRLDLRFLKQEVDLLKQDLSNSRSDTKSVTGRINEIENEVDFLERQVSNILLLRPVPKETPVVPLWTLNVLTAVIAIFILGMVILLIVLARGHV